MIIGILGKGGSGKSTVATHIVRLLSSDKTNTVLAIDADHNMDLSYNLGAPDDNAYLGSSLADLKAACGLSSMDDYRSALARSRPGLFSLSPLDPFTKKYARPIGSNMLLMAAGPQTDEVLADRACSHSLFTSLKIYLPLLSLRQGEWVVVDEKAGADGVSTGIPTGFDVALVVSEPTPHGLKTARQIAGLLDHFDVPYEFVLNKLSEDGSDMPRFIFELGKAPLATISYKRSFAAFEGNVLAPALARLSTEAGSFTGRRYERSRLKFAYNEI